MKSEELTENYKNFITWLLATPEYNEIICKEDNILCILTGSQIIGVTDSYSDYDLLLFTLDPAKDRKNIPFKDTFEGHYVHCMVNYIYNYFSYDTNVGSALKFAGIAKFSSLTEELCCWKNPKNNLGQKLFDVLFENKDRLARDFSYAFCTRMDHFLKLVTFNPELYCKYLKHKFYYHALCCYAELTNQELDSSILIEIKRMRYREVSKKAIDISLKWLCDLKQFLWDNLLDWMQDIDNFISINLKPVIEK